MTTRQICDALEAMDIPCDRRTLSVDVDLLNENGIEILWRRVGNSKADYIEDRSFSVPELKILLDAVQAASFITEKKYEQMEKKIAALGGSHAAELLKRNTVKFNTHKHSNESVFYNVDALERALQARRQVTFRYFDLDLQGRRSYRKNGELYLAEPVALVYTDDNYYLITYNTKYDHTTNYRVDRMDSVVVQQARISEPARQARKRVSAYTQEVFQMYGGEAHTVELELTADLMGAIYDRFGEKTKMKSTPEGTVKATVRVQYSPPFWGWLFQFGKKMRILHPESAIQEYRRRLEELME